MRIAQVAPLIEAVPPQLYGGTERVVSYLTEELVALGHDVTLYASGDSRTSARLLPCSRGALRLHGDGTDPIAPHFVMLERLAHELGQYDVVHYHVDYLHFPWSVRLPHPQLTTLHGRLDYPVLAALHRSFPGLPMVSISDSQRRPLPDLAWIGTVHHGLPQLLYEPRYEPGRYLLFLGRISPEKRVDRAIEIAERAGMPLKVAAKIDAVDRDYFAAEIRALLDHPLVEVIGEVGDEQKQHLLGGAAALLLPIDWPEPFGLVAIEALACGTPVVAWRNGALPEVIQHGVDGAIVQSIDEAVEAVRAIDRIERRHCRASFEQRFTARRMAEDYLALYERLVKR